MVLFGKINNLDTPTMYGPMGMSLMGIYALPYPIENGFFIVNITSNGTIFAIYKNQSIILKPGDNCTTVISSVNTTGLYLANTKNAEPYDYYNMTIIQWPVKNELSYTLTNEGIFNKTLLNKSYDK
jgi:hypothetical protein